MVKFDIIRKGKYAGKLQGSDGKIYTKSEMGVYLAAYEEPVKVLKVAKPKKKPTRSTPKKSRSKR